MTNCRHSWLFPRQFQPARGRVAEAPAKGSAPGDGGAPPATESLRKSFAEKLSRLCLAAAEAVVKLVLDSQRPVTFVTGLFVAGEGFEPR